MNRTTFLVDGFNLYPFLRTASKELSGAPTLPYKRKYKELVQIAEGTFYIRKERYVQHQFPPAVTLTTGRTISKPPTW